jgi:GTP cyclohydrolase II
MPLTGFRRLAEVNLPTQWANFRLFGFEAFHASTNGARQQLETALALVLGDLQDVPPVVRIHSRCTTGDAFHSLRCDCHDQLHLALRAIAEAGSGVLVYENQEGRGIGLIEKLRAYELQDHGLDTIDANLELGHEVDLRNYELAVRILSFFGIRSLRLMTNNPEKIHAVSSADIRIVERLSADVPLSLHSSRYVATKRERLGHLVDSPDPESRHPQQPPAGNLLVSKRLRVPSAITISGKELHDGDNCATNRNRA